MDPVSALFLVALLAGPVAFTAGAIRHARANGRALPTTSADWKPRMPALFAGRQPSPAPAITVAKDGTLKVAKPQSGVKAKARKGKPQTVPAILAAGFTENWVAKQAHRRANPKPPRSRRVFDRLVFPGGRKLGTPKPPEPATTTTKEAPKTMTEAPATTSSAAGSGPAEPPSPISSSNGHSGGGGGGGGAAADFFHSITAVTGPAKAGGIKSKQRAVKTLAAGMPMMASALEEFARWCQEPAQGYGAPLFERLQKMANCIRAAGMEGAEADTYMTELANKPLGEVAGSRVQAPSSREINTE